MYALFTALALIAQSPYYGPTPPPHFNTPVYPKELYHVQVNVYDYPELGGVKIQEVLFNNQSIPLKPPDVHGFRGAGGFQLQAGSYELTWRVSRDQFSWPRTVKYSQKITVAPRDTWLQVTIQGEKVTTL